MKAVEAGAIMPGRLDSPFEFPLALNSERRVDWLLADGSPRDAMPIGRLFARHKTDAEILSKELGWEKITLLSVGDGNSSSTGERFDSASSSLRVSTGEVAVTVR